MTVIKGIFVHTKEVTNLLISYLNIAPVSHLSLVPTNCRLFSRVGRLHMYSVTVSAVSQSTIFIFQEIKLFSLFSRSQGG